MRLEGMHVTAIERMTNSTNGNPRFRVAMVGRDGEGYIFPTQADAACSYDVENIVREHRRNPDATITVELTRAERIATMTREEAAETKPMKPEELGKYVCVPSSTCLHSPDITISSDGVWVKTGQQWSSAHRDCFEARNK